MTTTPPKEYPATPARLTQHGLPVWTLEGLPIPYQEMIQKEQYIKPWRNCRSCGGAGSFACMGCVTVTCADKTRYCSRKCQKKDWKRHKHNCTVVNTRERTLAEGYSLREAKARRLNHRQAVRWSDALTFAVGWVVRQAYLYCPIKNRRDVLLHIDLSSVLPDQPQSPLWTRSFEFLDCKWDSEQVPPAPPDCEGGLGLYEITIKDVFTKTGWIPLDMELFPCATPLRENWAYIFNLCCLMGDINSEITHIRLKFILETLSRYEEPQKYLKEFVVPKFDGKWNMDKEKLHNWMKLMYPVVGSFGSRFRPPCAVIPMMYGYTLEPGRLPNAIPHPFR